MGGGGRGWVALEAALAPARPRVAMSWRSRLVRPALVPLLWTVGSRWGRGVFVRCVSPVGRACAAWHSAPGAEGAASPKSGRSAAPAPPRAPAPPVRLPSASRPPSLQKREKLFAFPRVGGAESGFSSTEELYLEGLLLLFLLGAFLIYPAYSTTQVGRNVELVLTRRGLLSSRARLQKASVSTSAMAL